MEAATVCTTAASRLRVLGSAYLSGDAAPDARAYAEYSRLFGGSTGAPCPPCQSVFLAPGGHPDRKLADLPNKALTWYRRFGFGSFAGDHPADHAGLLLTFAGDLLDADPDPAMLTAYFNEHLRWIAGFCEQLAAQARHPFYRELAESTIEALRAYIASI